jgi:phosphatidylethanolamine-binding protein (PEBP) family uncharacterized protein
MRPPHPPLAILALALALALALGGCANSGTTANSKTLVPTITFQSSAVHEHALSALYTCDGKNIPPPLEWGNLPAGAGELVVFLLGFKPTRTKQTAISIEWAMAGINPQLHRLGAGELPHGASIGLNTHGSRKYNICPTKNTNERFQFMLYTTPSATKISPEFDAEQIFTALNQRNTEYSAPADGAFVTFYKRK